MRAARARETEPPMAPPSLVVLTPGQLVEIVRVAVDAALDARAPEEPASPFLDRHGAAKFLGVSIATLDRLQRETDIPCHRVGDVRRYEREELHRWALAQGRSLP